MLAYPDSMSAAVENLKRIWTEEELQRLPESGYDPVGDLFKEEDWE